MIGETVSHYRILEELGGGGMGVVYRAEDTRLKRTVALKFLHPEFTRDARAKQRFINEAQAASRLDHPNICTIHEIDETDDGRLFLALACYDGETVGERLEKGPMPLDEAMGLAIHVGRGLEKAHEAGIVHRDIKPDNIFLTEDGRAKILDFGLAKLAGQTRMTRVGSTVGTVAYMSPEQARGTDVGEQTDIWSLGVVLYEALTGNLPFPGERLESVLYSVVHEEPALPSSLRHDIPKEIEAVILKCLEKDPADRFSSASELVAALECVTGRRPSGSSLIEVATTRMIAARRARHGLPVAAAVIALSVIAALAVPNSRRATLNWVTGAPAPSVRLVAVLPFSSDGDEASERFAEGMRQYITLRIAQLERGDNDFRLIPAAELEEHRVNRPSEARDVSGATLGITGSVRRTGDDIFLGLELVSTETGRRLRPVWQAPWRRRDSIANVRVFQTDAAVGAAQLIVTSLTDADEELLSAGRTTVPTAFDAYIRALGSLSGAEGDSTDGTSEAMELLKRATALDPSYALAHAALGQAYLRAYLERKEHGYLELAESSTRRAALLDDRLAATHVTAGLVGMRDSDHEEAARHFQRVLELEPFNLKAREELAAIAMQADDNTLAEMTYRQAVDARESHWRPYCDLGLFYYLVGGRDDDALRWLNEAVSLAPRNPLPYTLIGAVYYRAEKYDEALALIDLARDAAPFRELYSFFGTVYFSQQQYLNACEWYERAVELDPSGYLTWGNLASAGKWVPGREERTADCYHRAIELAEEELKLKPGDSDLLFMLAEYHASLGQEGPAREYLSRVMETGENSSEIMFRVGLTHELLGERESAISWILRAVDGGYPLTEVETTPDLRELCADERYLERRARIEGG